MITLQTRLVTLYRNDKILYWSTVSILSTPCVNIGLFLTHFNILYYAFNLIIFIIYVDIMYKLLRIHPLLFIVT